MSIGTVRRGTRNSRWVFKLLASAIAVGCSSTPAEDTTTACATGYTACGAQCVSLQGDGAHCGACGTVCAAGTVCANGACSTGGCPAGTLQCGTSCVSTDTDPLHCGACNSPCAGSARCASGVCVGETGGTGGAPVASAGAGGLATGGAGTGGTPIHPTCPGDASQAYQGAPRLVPGTIEAEDFDPAGAQDSSTGNEGGAYRTDVDVDIKALGTGYAVGWMTAGEWLEYTIDVPAAGDYTLTLRAGAVEAGRTLELSSCSSALTAPIPVPVVGAWGEVATASAGTVRLEAGLQVIRVTVGASDYLDLDSLTFAASTGGTGGQPGTGGTGGTGGATGGAGGTGGTGGGQTCPLPSSFRWTSTGALAQPQEAGWHALKDFSVTKYNGNYIVYGTVANGGWNGFFSTFSSFDQWATAEQHYHSGHVAPTIFYFEPKNVWVLTYQWGFQYKTTTTPDVWSSWSAGSSLLSGDPTEDRGTGPIDQTVICDDASCYLFFNDDAGGVYRASMPIGSFPGTFSNATRIMDEPTSVIFEGIQVYSVKGSNQYLMIIENNGTRHFKAWTATDLGGTWTPLAGANTEQSPFAGRANTTWPGGQWTNDISHGDLVRENPSQKMEIDPCNLRLLYQGRDPNVNVDYGALPYRPGLLTATN